MELIYSAQKSNFEPGRVYQNPRFFDGVLAEGITSVVIVGDWPRVKATYEQAGIAVTVVSPRDRLPAPGAGTKVLPKSENPAPTNDDDKPEFPSEEEASEMSYRELKALIAGLNPDADVANKKAALEWLNANRPATE